MKAYEFQSSVMNESITLQSPLNSLKISAQLTSGAFQRGNRIYSGDYIPDESDSPQKTQSVITPPFSTYEETSDEFKYQRIEKISAFGFNGKAESCHLMSASHCRTHPHSYGQYDNDPNNRIAMSRDLHGWFDKLNTDIPSFNLRLVSISDNPVVEGRYKIVLAVEALNQISADSIFPRLIDGSSQTENPLVMHTFVYVRKPSVFKLCLEWKEKQIDNAWKEYYSMESAIP